MVDLNYENAYNCSTKDEVDSIVDRLCIFPPMALGNSTWLCDGCCSRLDGSSWPALVGSSLQPIELELEDLLVQKRIQALLSWHWWPFGLII